MYALHVASFFFGHWLFHPLVSRGYQFWSGIAGCFVSLGMFSGLLVGWRHVNCHAPWCFRLGKHPTADGQFKLCRKHHPDLPDKQPDLREIHRIHDDYVKLAQRGEHVLLGRIEELQRKQDALHKVITGRG